MFASNKSVKILFGIFLIIFSLFFLFPLEFTRSNHFADNPDEGVYYVSLDSILANSASLNFDKANAAYIKQKMINFEMTPNLNPKYKNEYYRVLNANGFKSINDIADYNQVRMLAENTYRIIDSYHFDGKFVSANDLYNWKKEHTRRILNYNLGGLYHHLVDNYVTRILFAVDSGVHIGVFSGFLVNNHTTVLGTQFMTGMPLLTALYVLPKYGFNNLGNYSGLVPWCAFWSGYLTDKTLRKILDISGMDLITISKTDIKKRIKNGEIINIPNVIKLKDHRDDRFGSDFVTYRNTNSYGVAYLANNISLVDKNEVNKYEKMIKQYFARPVDANNAKFVAATTALYNKLDVIKTKHDILLESSDQEIKSAKFESAPSGTVDLKGIVGSRAYMTTNCNKEHCILVFNMSDAPGWHAYVNNAYAHIFRVNFAFMGIKVGRGISHVWFIYDSIYGLLSYFLSMLTLITIFMLGSSRLKKRQY